MRGSGPPLSGAGKACSRAYVLHLVVICAYFCFDVSQFTYGKHATVFARGLGPPMAWGLALKSELLSYTLLLGIYLGVLDTRQGS